MLADGLHRDPPPLYGVTLLAVGAHLATVNVGVAIRTAQADVAEDQAVVALTTADTQVHAAKGIRSLVVIEIR